MNLKGNYGRCGEPWTNRRKIWRIPYTIGRVLLTRGNLMAWERKRNAETDAKGSRTLEHLMTFLRLEVQGEEMVQLAKSGFGTPIRKRDSPTERVKPTELMTASALASSEKSSHQERKVRILIDTACENSYISESVTSILKATPLREETTLLDNC
ncbi:uncharacterized protein TNCV_2009981 [Trichonephila clavipes]|nr:uncharacterized protein TNCV_2009981 [Trichonephila clavipes]